MRFAHLYRISFYVMLFLATLTLSIDASGDFPLAPLYPMAVAAVGILAFLTVDRDPSRGLPPGLAKFLSLGSVGLTLFEYWYDPNLLVLAMGHWLVYLMLIKMLMPKSVEDDWFLYLLALTQVVVGAFLPGENVGIALMLWAVAALWTLGLFYLQREAAPAARTNSRAEVTPAPDPKEPYPGLIDPPFILSGMKVAFLTLVLGGLIFLMMPRRGIEAQPRGRGTAPPQNLTGFSDTVQLGQMGQILESEAVVMNVELYSGDDQRIAPEGEDLWRGVVLQTYSQGQWSRPRRREAEIEEIESPGRLAQRRVRQMIRLEPTSSEVLFAMRPFIRVEGSNLLFSKSGGTLFRGELNSRSLLRNVRPRIGPYDYSVTSEVVTGLESGLVQPGERYPSPGELDELLDVPRDESLREVLDDVVATVLAEIPPEERVRRARALESYLRDSGLFGYSLRMDVVDPTIDPIADFLRNRKQGHCEYYASALTMLLRAAGIEARMVNGFKGGDWNDFGQVLVVRQKHAHSWVEALIGESTMNGSRRPVWLTLDPTPALQRAESVAKVGGFSTRFRFFSDYVRYLWIFYVVGFNEERQERLIYGPLRELVAEARKGFGVMGDWLSTLSGGLLDFPDLRSFFSVRGFFVSFFTLLILVGLARAFRWVVVRYIFRRRALDEDDGDSASVLASYRRLVRLLAEMGLHRPPAETPREFAHRAADVLSARGPEVEALAGIPARVVDIFYGIRFGDRPLDPADRHQLERGLDALEVSLRPPKTA